MSPCHTSQLSVAHPCKGIFWSCLPWEVQQTQEPLLLFEPLGTSQLWSGRRYSSICWGFGHVNLGTVLQAKELCCHCTHLFEWFFFFSFPFPKFPLTRTSYRKEKPSPRLDFCTFKINPGKKIGFQYQVSPWPPPLLNSGKPPPISAIFYYSWMLFNNGRFLHSWWN